MDIKKQSIVVVVLYALFAMIGMASAPGDNFAFKFGYGLGYAVWVPVVWIIVLALRKLALWLMKE